MSSDNDKLLILTLLLVEEKNREYGIRSLNNIGLPLTKQNSWGSGSGKRK